MSGVLEVRCRLQRGAFEVDVDARFARGVTGLFGPSGAGKTSLLLALAGLIKADELRVTLDGECLVDSESGLVPPPHLRRIGMMFQEHRLFPHRSVKANLRYGMAGVARSASAHSGRGDLGQSPSSDPSAPTRGATAPTFAEIVELLDIAPLLARRPDACSGGERQRVALGRALLGNPRVLLLDEPLASLDRGLKRQILPYLRRVRERFQIPMLVVSHDLSDLLTLTDELALVDQGQLVAQGTMAELVTRAETLERLHDAGLLFALPGRVVRRDDDGLSWVQADGPGKVTIACGDCRDPLGTPVEILLRPEDVILARPPVDTRLSLTNRLTGRITHIAHGSERVMVSLDCGLSVPMIAEVTERAVRSLALAPGEEVVALCKAQATRTRGTAVAR